MQTDYTQMQNNFNPERDYTQLTLEELKAHKAHLSHRMKKRLIIMDKINSASHPNEYMKEVDISQAIQKDFDAINEQIKLKELKV